jgi:uncharacterized protein (DUF427 family)
MVIPPAVFNTPLSPKRTKVSGALATPLFPEVGAAPARRSPDCAAVRQARHAPACLARSAGGPIFRFPRNSHGGLIMQAVWQGKVIAESDRTVEVGGYRYFPRESVQMELLQVASKTESDLACPHGVQFYDVAADGARSARAAWSYEAPLPKMQQVDHWIGFWEDVEVK